MAGGDYLYCKTCNHKALYIGDLDWPDGVTIIVYCAEHDPEAADAASPSVTLNTYLNPWHHVEIERIRTNAKTGLDFQSKQKWALAGIDCIELRQSYRDQDGEELRIDRIRIGIAAVPDAIAKIQQVAGIEAVDAVRVAIDRDEFIAWLDEENAPLTGPSDLSSYERGYLDAMHRTRRALSPSGTPEPERGE